MDSTSQAPLSALIPPLHTKFTDHSYANFLDTFLTSKLGVHAIGAPLGATGDIVSTARHPLSLGQSGPLILAYADPVAFANKFGRRFNAEMLGEAILTCVMHSPECEGVLVNSAMAELSVAIHRPTIMRMMHNRKLIHPPIQRPWWKFW